MPEISVPVSVPLTDHDLISLPPEELGTNLRRMAQAWQERQLPADEAAQALDQVMARLRGLADQEFRRSLDAQGKTAEGRTAAAAADQLIRQKVHIVAEIQRPFNLRVHADQHPGGYDELRLALLHLPDCPPPDGSVPPV